MFTEEPQGENDLGLEGVQEPQHEAPQDRSIPAAITDTGCERELNEDRYAVIESPSGLAWLVCDGMGGQAGGELAAQLAIDGMRRDLEGMPARQPLQALKSSILEANRIIVLRRQNQAFARMGTTIVGALFSGIEVAIGHVGDSRAYLVRGSAIEQLTTDHTYVQELVDKGHIKHEEALSHPQAHILTRAIGSEPGLVVDMQRFFIWDATQAESAESDILVLCTDGLYSHISDVEIAACVSEESPKRACVKLVELAKSRGGFDNITIAVIPLGGQLKDQPPYGYDESEVLRQLQEKNRPVEAERVKSPSLVKTVGAIVILTVLFILLIVFAMVFVLSK